MKIHSYSTSPRHEEANTRTANSNRKAGTPAASAAAKKPNGVETARGDSSVRRLQRPARTVPNSTPVAARNRNPELDNKANRLAVATARRRTQLEKLRENQRTSSAHSTEEEEVEEEEEEEGEEKLEPLDDEETDEVVEEEEQVEEEEEEEQESAAKRPRRGEVKVEVASPPQSGKEQQQAERRGQKLVRIAGTEQQQTEVEEGEEEEDDGTSSSTASAEEEIGEEMEPLGGPKGGPRVVSTASSRVPLGRVGSSSARGSTILVAEEDYDEQQDQQVDEEDAGMDEYEGGGAAGVGALGGGSEDMEDTDGALTGNRLFRKKVKRKVHTRTNSASGAGSSLGIGGLGGGANSNQITSSKAKLQMLQEFPTLFIGLRRNRMFLVNALAQSFDLNQRDIVLTLRKIKQNESSARLANFFGIGAAEVDLLFHTSVPKIADCLRNFIVWPDDFTMKLNVPISLRQHFNRIHLILNYLVLRVKQNAVQQLPPSEIGSAYCPVDQCHKLKYLVASTLDGCVCFVSRAFGVQTDDEQLLAQSGFLTKFKTNTNLIAGQNFHNFEDRLANGHDHTNNNGGGGGRNRRPRTAGGATDDDDLERVLGGGGGSCDDDNFEDIVSQKISKSRTFKLKNYIENILENFQNHQMLSPHTCIDGRTFKLLDDIVVIVGALINLQKQEID